MEKEAGHVEDKYCDAAIKPEDKTRTCNKHLCPAKYGDYKLTQSPQ